ncbi:class I SAM-dependent methyltransferase [Gordonia hankookensis]|nr:class I SAM-dependent methyltransferase [Gordonia hankookensis]
MALPVDDPWPRLIAETIGRDRMVVWDVDGSSGLPATALAGTGHVAGAVQELRDQVDLVLVGHALAHVDDFDGLIAEAAAVLAPHGLVAIDFHHVLGLAQGQFDVVSHSHRSYLSLLSLEHALERNGLVTIAAQQISEYAGTVRVLAASAATSTQVADGLFDPERIRTVERAERVTDASGYSDLGRRARHVCDDLTEFLRGCRRDGRSVVGYGAASRATALINIAGIGTDLLPLVADRSTAKQGRLLPRALIPIRDPAAIEEAAADDIVILVWPLAAQIMEQLAMARHRNARFVRFMPELTFLT